MSILTNVIDTKINCHLILYACTVPVNVDCKNMTIIDTNAINICNSPSDNMLTNMVSTDQQTEQ